MDETTQSTVSYDMEEGYDPILPVGYTEGDDFFDTGSWTGTNDGGSATAEETAATETDSTGTDATDAPPAIEEQTTSEETGDNADSADTTPATETLELPQSSKRKVKYAFNHEDVEEEYEDTDLPEIFQKARSVDRYKEREARARTIAKALGYNSEAEMLDAVAKNAKDSTRESLLDKGMPEEFVDDYIERKYGSIPAEPTEPPKQVAEPAQAQKPGRDVQKEALEFIRDNPHMKNQQLPDEVMTAWSAGKPLKEAYRDYTDKSRQAETERLHKENAILKQNAASAAKAPVSGVSKGGNAQEKPDDDFLRGFNSDNW